MAMTMELYSNLYSGMLENNFADLTGAAAISCALLTEDKAIAFDRGHVNITSVETYEVDDQVQTDYARQDLTGVNVDVTGAVITLDAADLSFGATVTLTAKAAVLFAKADGRLIAFIDFGEERATAGTLFEIKWHANGIFKTTIQTE